MAGRDCWPRPTPWPLSIAGSRPLTAIFKSTRCRLNAAKAREYVSLCEDLIAGYYSLAYGSVEPEKAPPRLTKGLARHPVPVMLLARLAVDRRFRGRSLGSELLRDALLRTLAAADIAGLRAVIVDAKDEPARRFYQRYGFESFPGDPLRLALLVKDARVLVAKP